MDKIILRVPATIQKIQTLEDKGLKLSVLTQELNEEDNATLFKLNQKIGWFAFCEQKMAEEDLKDLPKIEGEFKEKPDHIRFGNVLWRVLEKKIGKKPTEMQFREFYHQEYARMIEHYKEKLD